MAGYFTAQPRVTMTGANWQTWQEGGDVWKQGSSIPIHDNEMLYSPLESTWYQQPPTPGFPGSSTSTSISRQHIERPSYTHVFANGMPSPYPETFASDIHTQSPSPTQGISSSSSMYQVGEFVFPATPLGSEKSLKPERDANTAPWSPTAYDTSARQSMHVWNEEQHSKSSSPTTFSKQGGKTHKRSKTETERDQKSWKAAHNLVERNYRDRLNDQIQELSNLLFDNGDESKGSKPPKSLVISTAKDRLRELSLQNRDLLGEVEKLKQHIAVLDHLARS